MDAISPLLTIIDAYKASSGRADATISKSVFGDGMRISALRAGGGITVNRYANAMQWFSDHWPDDYQWPAAVPRPERHAA